MHVDSGEEYILHENERIDQPQARSFLFSYFSLYEYRIVKYNKNIIMIRLCYNKTQYQEFIT